jgi:hypothetical protein
MSSGIQTGSVRPAPDGSHGAGRDGEPGRSLIFGFGLGIPVGSLRGRGLSIGISRPGSRGGPAGALTPGRGRRGGSCVPARWVVTKASRRLLLGNRASQAGNRAVEDSSRARGPSAAPMRMGQNRLGAAPHAALAPVCASAPALRRRLVPPLHPRRLIQHHPLGASDWAPTHPVRRGGTRAR